VDDELANCQSALFYFSGPPAGVNIIVDQVSIKPYNVDVCTGAILDEHFTTSFNGWSGNYNWGGYELVSETSCAKNELCAYSLQIFKITNTTSPLSSIFLFAYRTGHL
jgi:hypothetical protein